MTKLTTSNCVLGFLYLWLRGKVAKIALISTESPYWPFHVLAVTKNDKVLHFGVDDLDGEQIPWWYEGRFWVMRMDRAMYLLEKHNRKLIAVRDFDLPCKLVIICVASFLFFPFTVGWFVYPICHMVYWLVDAIYKRFF